tara:strand:- start:1505 stop:1993 length:489 start_codon:yes stop_codon:yes gene_type:complete
MGGAVAETVEAVNPCAECGYDLGPNYIEAYDGDTCPECGTPFDRFNVTPESTSPWEEIDDDDDDDPSLAEQCDAMLENYDSVRLSLREAVMADSYVEFDWPSGWDWSQVRGCRVNWDFVVITWIDGSESSIERPDLAIDNSTIETHGSYSIFSPDGDMWDEC